MTAPEIAPPPAPVNRQRTAVGIEHPEGWLLLALSIVALALLASATSLHNGFAYDDRWIIADNKRIHDLHAPWKFFSQTYWPNVRAALYRPLTILFYSAQWVVGRGSPFVFHAVNVALYVLVSVLVLWLALQILPRGAAWVAAALFAVHPVHVEAVGNVVGQAELWTAVVLVGGVALYLRDRRDGLPLRRQSAFVIVGLYFAGMMVKENAIVLPALIVAADVLLVDDRRPWRERARSLFPLLAWMTAFAVFFLWLRVNILDDIGGDTPHPALMHLTLVQRSFVMLGLVPEFGRLFVWPAHLYADYSPQQVHVHPAPNIEQIPGVLLLGCLVILFFVSVRRAPVAAFGLSWLAISIAPVSNILIPTGILIAERTLLVPSVGAVLAAAVLAPWVFDRLGGQPRTVRLAAGGAFAALLTAGFARSAERQYDWHDTEAVFRVLATDSPLSFKAHYAYGGELFEQKRPAEAEREWRMAIALFPTYFGVYTDLAHKYREAHVCRAAIPNYEKSLEMEPDQTYAHVGLIACYLETAQWHKARSAARLAIADGYSRQAFSWLAERADSALAASDSLDPTNKWTGRSTITKP